MKIEVKKTTDVNYAPLVFSEKNVNEHEALQKNVLEYFDLKGFDFLTISEFLQLTRQEMPAKYEQKSKDSAFFTYGFYFFFAKYCEDMGAFLERLETPSHLISSELRQAQGLAVQMSTGEAMLSFLQVFFGLKNYNDASEMLLFDFLLAKKTAYNKQIVELQYNYLCSKKLKQQK